MGADRQDGAGGGPRARARWGWAAALLLSLGAASPAAAQNVTPVSDLEFGTIAVSQTAGTVSIAPNGTVNCGPHTCLGGQVRALFQVNGFPLTTYDISFSSGDQLDRVGGGGSIPLQTLQATGGNRVSMGLLGSGSFRVGGALFLVPATPGGDYTGTYQVTVELP